ncbi:hypothetical protein [Cupriavidus sp.]|uniref:hypothetical protein n=1 Tax=Cupriavidus sp. TaxID=1873897 RepID=UPI0025BC0F37|nr:hypothetical protein [Cupriavidus sp.]MCA3189859.1 hypothetical protein [Cupriavidus sp.]MCA3196758.1 hypothetical protein [Cupriavidus sp.]MCA3204257.1 hypothetical protein [Cupriavidus sp.]MCA3208287.1 hypothetical protein [Cupriavidus sp.]
MLISPPFLPQDALIPSELVSTDPMMDWVDKYEPGHHGIYPIAFDRRWHCGMHLCPDYQNEPVRAIADGEVVAYRVCQTSIVQPEEGRGSTCDKPKSNAGFVLLRHRTETGQGRAMTFYSLYMHLLDLSSYLGIGTAISNPQAVGSSAGLPSWLCFPTDGVVTPDDLNVHRKDILGYPGECDGLLHLHFEIFMTEADFETWFERTGNDRRASPHPVTPASNEYWGHSYLVIPAGQRFFRIPPGINRSDTPYFPPLNDGAVDDSSNLYVEIYFHKGQRYTRSWLEKDGAITALTPDPVRDVYDDYEYKLHDRAVALYPACPSDGYELLRFGRVLSDRPTLPARDRKAWVAVTFEAERRGYIDLAQESIQKLSDADFPAFHWQKIVEANSPFDDDGLCDYEALKMLLQVEDKWRLPATGRDEKGCKREDVVVAYIRNNDSVRARLRGMICHAPSEWDASNNEARYKRLKEPGEFFGKRMDIDPDGYKNFLASIRKLQFMGQTPLGEEKKFWYFHPMAFIRHMRNCGWRSAEELASTFPAHMHYTDSGHPRKAIKTPGAIYAITRDAALNRIAEHVMSLNACLRKYLGHDAQRTAIFLAQALLETAQWRSLPGKRRKLHEWGFGEYAAANPATKHYGPFYGRGIMQLTWAGNYRNYGDFAAIPSRDAEPYVERLTPSSPRITADSLHYTHSPADGGTFMQWAPRYGPDILAEDAHHACDSGGFYWVTKPFSGQSNINRVADQPYSPARVGLINRLVNGGGNGYYERQAYTLFILNQLTDVLMNANSIAIDPPAPRARVNCDMSRAGK